MGEDPGRVRAASAGHAGGTEAQTPDQQGWYGKNHRCDKGAVGKGQSGQGATAHSLQESCPEEGRWHEGDADRGGKAEWPGQENCGEKDGPGFHAGGNGSFCLVGFRKHACVHVFCDLFRLAYSSTLFPSSRERISASLSRRLRRSAGIRFMSLQLRGVHITDRKSTRLNSSHA